MKLIADENLHRKIITSLREVGHEVFSIQDNNSGITDEEILEKYSAADSIIITQDKDFGDLTFFKKINSNCIILLRFPAKDIDKILIVLTNFLVENKMNFLKGKFIVLTPVKKRIRKINENI